jgi:zinc transport system permease protein
MPEVFTYGFMQRALLAGAITALICPAIGVFLVPRRLSLIADTLAHVALAGVALGLVAGVSPILGALVVTAVGAVGIERLRARGALAGDASLAVFLSGGLALAVVLIGLGRGFTVDLFAVLFGSILTVTTADLWLIAALGIVVGVTIGALYPRLLAVTLNEDLARTSGVPVAMLNLVMTVLTALTTVIAMRMVGVLLVSAMIVIPTLAGFALARSFRGALLIAMIFALVAMGSGLVLAYYLGLAAGASVVLTALALFALTSPVRRLRPARAAVAVALGVLTLAAPAGAHPHVWVDYTITVRFSPDGPDGVRVDWAFDEMISALIIQKYDTDRNGVFSKTEIRALEREHFVHLKDFSYFVELKVDGVTIPVTEVKDFDAKNIRGQLHYLFTVPIPRAARRDGTVDVNVTDPSFYTAFTMTAQPIAADGATSHRVDCAPVRDSKTKLLEVLRCTYHRQAR